MVQVFLQNGATSFPDPGNWNPSLNMVECVGSGGRGSANYTGGPLGVDIEVIATPDDPTPTPYGTVGVSGGSGSYGWDVNLNPLFPVVVNVAQQGLSLSQTNQWNAGTYWGNSTQPQAGSVCGYSGNSGQGRNGGGQGASPGYPNGFAGAYGITGSTFGYGGAGAGGPHGAGSQAPTNQAGGAADGGTVAGGAAATNGNAGTQWDSVHGCGSGGGGGGLSTGAAGNGGNYGAAGGAGGQSTANGLGANGLMVITWTPALPIATYILMAA